jgi:hypothetical protein
MDTIALVPVEGPASRELVSPQLVSARNVSSDFVSKTRLFAMVAGFFVAPVGLHRLGIVPCRWRYLS